MSEFFAMGGYGAYVWSAFGFAAVVLVGLLAHSWRAARRREHELRQLRHLARSARPAPASASLAATAGSGAVAGAGPAEAGK